MSDDNLVVTYIKEMTSLYEKLRAEKIDPEKHLLQLIDLESQFVDELIKSNKINSVFECLLNYLVKHKDMRSFKSYFREREFTFNNINQLIKNKNYINVAKKYHLNFMFCQFVVENFKVNKKIKSIYAKIKKIRDEVISMYLHYTLNRAKVFLKYANNVLSFNDLINIANEGLIIAVDKYKPSKKGRTPFHMVAIGRMVASLISAQTSSAPVKLTYQPARQLYTIKRLLELDPSMSYDEVANLLEISETEVVNLINSTQSVSLDEVFCNEDDYGGVSMLDLVSKTQYDDSDLSLEMRDIIEVVKNTVVNHLSIMEKKVLSIMGMNIVDSN